MGNGEWGGMAKQELRKIREWLPFADNANTAAICDGVGPSGDSAQARYKRPGAGGLRWRGVAYSVDVDRREGEKNKK